MRRRRRGTVINLFSFQDVMASVIGVLFFIVLLMSLDIVNKQTVDGAQIKSPDENQIASLREEAAKQRDELKKWTDELERLSDRAKFFSSYDERGALQQVKGLQRQLAQLYEEIRRAEQGTNDLHKQHDTKTQELTDKQARLKELERRLAELKEQVGSGVPRPRVTFILDQVGDKMVPWLVEINSDQIRIGASDGRSASMKFDAKSFDVRKDQFTAWAKTQDSGTHYFLLLIKPSGIANAGQLLELLEKPLGFQVGTDLLPESWTPFE